MKILIRDKSLTGKVAQEFELELEASTITVRELIRSRVHQEVNIFNSNRSVPYMGLVEPGAKELLLNPARSNGLRQQDPVKQAEIALKAFDNNGFLLLVDNKQCTDLNDEINLQPDTTISFIKLTPLVGG
ncbi:hypothetical protein F0L74_11695 [Chitinophaga agrisoli]|uniref:Uncharacterized protein n=1 Tax=Chitinophaga agrisoli TaxID=2607653 RepID=A0A5B2VV90_9BACT|nr:hypothetical protein [Chitinophaga agrisoli]KAA2243171.1 hypothetical protein F0L74_11695 [Chitinophaga agrisoli]